MKDNQIVRYFCFSILFGVIGLAVSGCKHSSEPGVQGKGLVLPFGIIPDVPTIDGGWFSTISGGYEGTSDTSKTASTQVALSYHDWPGAITVKVDGSSVADYITDQWFSGSPNQAHAWHVDSNSADGIPLIDYTIRAVAPPTISSPAMKDSIPNTGFTVTWATTADSSSGVIIMLAATPPALDTTSLDTIGTRMISNAPDNGSYTFSSSLLSSIPSGFMVRVFVLRYVVDVATISSKNYAFINGYQMGGVYYMK